MANKSIPDLHQTVAVWLVIVKELNDTDLQNLARIVNNLNGTNKSILLGMLMI